VVVEIFRTLAGPLFLAGTARGGVTANPDDVATSARADLSNRFEAMRERDAERKGDG
jgi:hypothetical protein